MSRSSSRIASESRWRSSIRGPRSRGGRARSSRAARTPPWSKPVAITVTRISSVMPSSITAPKMMFEFGVGGGVDQLGRLVDLEQPEVAPAGDVEQDAGGALDGFLQQRRGDRLLGGLRRARLARGGADPHQRRPGVLHDRPDVGEVEVDQAGDRDQVGDALDALAQHVVGLAERVEDARAALDHREQLLVGDHDQRVHHLAQAVDPLLRLARRCEPSKANGRVTTPTVSAPISFLAISAITGAAPVPVPPPSPAVTNTMSAPLSASLMSSRVSAAAPWPICGLAPAPRPFVSGGADVQLEVGVRHLQRLGVGVGRDELHAGQPGVDHPVHGVGAAAADADDFDHCEITAGFHESFRPYL